MGFKTRLDRLVRLRERAEESGKVALGRARQATLQAAALLERARERTLVDDRRASIAARWQDSEVARARALALVRVAESSLRDAQDRERETRLDYEKAHREAEVVRRVAQARRDTMEREADRAERKLLDELAGLQFERDR
jgi:flagellar biosynthesis chaperone FliJ